AGADCDRDLEEKEEKEKATGATSSCCTDETSEDHRQNSKETTQEHHAASSTMCTPAPPLSKNDNDPRRGADAINVEPKVATLKDFSSSHGIIDTDALAGLVWFGGSPLREEEDADDLSEDKGDPI
ncbi:unnamed protein product, partial [Amoebophrya sp. A120]